MSDDVSISKHPLNSFTVDVQEWFHANLLDGLEDPIEPDHLVVAETQQLMELLGEAGAKATFFVLGETATKYPDLVRQIAAQGHEIASHGLTHDLVYEMQRDEFHDKARQSRALLEEISGTPVVGYRAASWSVGPKTPWFWQALRDAGYLYSSSLFPFSTFLYGDSNAPRFGHRRDGVFEIPPTTAQFFGRRVPFSGGFYLRVLPTPLVTGLSRRVNREDAAVIYYIHPREIDVNQPKVPLSPTSRIIHYWGTRGTPKKLRRVLASSSFQTMAQLYASLINDAA